MTINEGNNHEGSMAALDRYVAPGLRLWMLIALVSGILLIMGIHIYFLLPIIGRIRNDTPSFVFFRSAIYRLVID